MHNKAVPTSRVLPVVRINDDTMKSLKISI